jgi:predicted nucleic acid-binding protein
VTRDFEVPAVAARNAVQSLLRHPARIVGASDTVSLDAYEMGVENDRDVYDSFILALARATEADHLVTGDRDFDALCAGDPVAYRNPIPEDKLTSPSRIDG